MYDYKLVSVNNFITVIWGLSIIPINATLRFDWPLHASGASPRIWTCDTRLLLLAVNWVGSGHETVYHRVGLHPWFVYSVIHVTVHEYSRVHPIIHLAWLKSTCKFYSMRSKPSSPWLFRCCVTKLNPLCGYSSFQGFIELVSTVYTVCYCFFFPSCELQDSQTICGLRMYISQSL